MPSRLAITAVLFLAVAAAAPALDVTTRLLDAEAGSWIRNNRADDYSYTEYVASVTDTTITLQLIHEHRGHIRSNKLVRIPRNYIKENGIDPHAPGAMADSIDTDGQTYTVTRVRVAKDGTDTDYYFWDQQPVTGILRKDVLPDTGPTRVTTTWQHRGYRPDAIILKAGEAEEANAEFGIPE